MILALIAVWIFWPKREHTPVVTDVKKSMQKLNITSSAFAQNEIMPARFTCDAKVPLSPPLAISGIPAGAKTLALILHDPDAPMAGGFTHWVKFNMPVNGQVASYKVESIKLKEGEEPAGVSGKGNGSELSYHAPCPPSGTHRYIFTIYALDAELTLKEGATKTELESAMQGHILGKGELIGLYSRGK